MIYNALSLTKTANERSKCFTRESPSKNGKKWGEKKEKAQHGWKHKSEQIVNIVIMVQIETLSFGHLSVELFAKYRTLAWPFLIKVYYYYWDHYHSPADVWGKRLYPFGTIFEACTESDFQESRFFIFGEKFI